MPRKSLQLQRPLQVLVSSNDKANELACDIITNILSIDEIRKATLASIPAEHIVSRRKDMTMHDIAFEYLWDQLFNF